MMSLFNSFDLFFHYFQFFLVVAVLMCLNSCVYHFSGFNSFNVICMETSFNFFETLKPKSYTMFSIFLFFSTMFLIFYFNILSIFPFNFSFTSQLSLVIFFSLVFWFSFFIFNIYNNNTGFWLHLIPEGTPMLLTWFLFLIELVSSFIRPITLTVRLLANILAGHLLMILLSKLVFSFTLASVFYLGLNLVEIFVSIIQSYIFVTMLCLYYSDL